MSGEGGPGRPQHTPTDANRRTVEFMRFIKRSHDDISALLGIDPKTLRKHYARELSAGDQKISVAVTQTTIQVAMGMFGADGKADARSADPATLRFLMDRVVLPPRVTRLQHSGGIAAVDPEKLAAALTEDELRAYDAIHDKIAAVVADPARDDPGGYGDQGEGEGEE